MIVRFIWLDQSFAMTQSTSLIFSSLEWAIGNLLVSQSEFITLIKGKTTNNHTWLLGTTGTVCRFVVLQHDRSFY